LACYAGLPRFIEFHLHGRFLEKAIESWSRPVKFEYRV